MNGMPLGQIAGIDKPISRLVQGTMLFEKLDGERAIFELLDGVAEAGCTAFDTAHVYGGGQSELAFGRWLRSRGNRDDVVIIGKGCEPSDDGPRLTPANLEKDLNESLARMQVDYIDLYLLHVDHPSADIELMMDALEAHRQAGKLASYGVSNWTSDRIRAANAYAETGGIAPIAASSVNLSLAIQAELPWRGNLSISGDDAKDERDFYEATQLPLLTWSSLAGGFFSGRFQRETLAEMTEYFDAVTARTYGSERNFTRLARAAELGRRYGATAAQVALHWVFAQPLNVFPLVGCATPVEFTENVDALNLGLSSDELTWLSSGGESPRTLTKK